MKKRFKKKESIDLLLPVPKETPDFGFPNPST
jgi:hypothetical protein